MKPQNVGNDQSSRISYGTDFFWPGETCAASRAEQLRHLRAGIPTQSAALLASAQAFNRISQTWLMLRQPCCDTQRHEPCDPTTKLRIPVFGPGLGRQLHAGRCQEPPQPASQLHVLRTETLPETGENCGRSSRGALPRAQVYPSHAEL